MTIGYDWRVASSWKYWSLFRVDPSPQFLADHGGHLYPVDHSWRAQFEGAIAKLVTGHGQGRDFGHIAGCSTVKSMPES